MITAEFCNLAGVSWIFPIYSFEKNLEEKLEQNASIVQYFWKCLPHFIVNPIPIIFGNIIFPINIKRFINGSSFIVGNDGVIGSVDLVT